MAQSRVITFRLNPDDEDERRALEWLERLESQGFSMKQVMLAAMLQRANIDPVNPQNILQRVTELLISMDDLKDVVNELKKGSFTAHPPTTSAQPAPPSNQISDDDPLVQALKQRARAGKRFNT